MAVGWVAIGVTIALFFANRFSLRRERKERKEEIERERNERRQERDGEKTLQETAELHLELFVDEGKPVLRVTNLGPRYATDVQRSFVSSMGANGGKNIAGLMQPGEFQDVEIPLSDREDLNMEMPITWRDGRGLHRLPFAIPTPERFSWDLRIKGRIRELPKE
jgi:hypothetical protein